MAIVGTILNACWIAIVAIPSSTVLYFAVCRLHINGSSYGLLLLEVFALTLPISLTFATDAARNERLSWDERVHWALGLVVASPIAIPRYWWRFLREPKRTR